MPFLTGSGSLGACAKRTSISDDSSAMVVFKRRLRSWPFLHVLHKHRLNRLVDACSTLFRNLAAACSFVSADGGPLRSDARS